MNSGSDFGSVDAVQKLGQGESDAGMPIATDDFVLAEFDKLIDSDVEADEIVNNRDS